MSQNSWRENLKIYQFDEGEYLWNLGRTLAQFEDLKSSNLSRFERMSQINILRSIRKQHRPT
jgi:hypothetical protein